VSETTRRFLSVIVVILAVMSIVLNVHAETETGGGSGALNSGIGGSGGAGNGQGGGVNPPNGAAGESSEEGLAEL
jgi:hypothetical protein